MLKKALQNPWFIALSAFVIRVAIVAYFYRQAGYTLLTVWNNGYESAHVAASVAAGAGFSSPFPAPTGPTALIPPAYPVILAGIFHFFGPLTAASALVATGLNLLLSSVTAVFVYLLAKRTFDERIAVVGAWIWAIYLPVILSAGFHLWDGTLAVFMAGAMFVVGRTLPANGSRRWAWFGLLIGVSALVNPSLLVIGGALLLWAAWHSRQSWLPRLSVAAVVIVLLLIPWTVRNYRVMHQLMPMRSGFGLELWLGNHDGADGYVHAVLHPVYSTAEMKQYSTRGEMAYMAWKQQEAVHYIRDHKWEFVKLTWTRISSFWGGTFLNGFEPMFLPTVILGLTGLLLLARRDRASMWMFLLPLAFYPLPFYITHADLRYRLPIEPLLIPLSAATLVAAFDWVRLKRATG